MNISFSSKGDFDVVRSWLDKASKSNPSAVLNKIASEGTTSLKNNTPKKTGRTASGWTSEVVSKGDVTEVYWKNQANPELSVNLAKLIELGHGTGTGGYVPPKPYIKQAMGPVWKSVDDRVIKELIK